MNAEVSTGEILAFANDRLSEMLLKPVTRRTIDYWISIGLIDHPKRKGKAGKGLFPDWIKFRVVNIRELQERYNFTISDIQTLLVRGSQLSDTLSFLAEVQRIYGYSMIPYARVYTCSNLIGNDAASEAANFYITTRTREGDEEIYVDQVAELLGLETQVVMDLARSREIPCHGQSQLRFLRREITKWKEANASTTPTEFTDVMAHLIQLNNELGNVQNLDDLSEKSHEWLAYWIDAVDNELWRLRRLSREAQMRKKVDI